jgi:hypothetical protein
MRHGWVMGRGVVWLCCVAACGGGQGDGGNAGGSGSGGSSVTSAGGSKNSEASVPAVTKACEEVCDLYAASCGAPCSTSCNIERRVYGEACDAQGERFYECAKSASFDCSEDNLTLAARGCAQQLTDYVTCYALDGVACMREPGFDTQCEDEPNKPFAMRCVSDAAPGDCVPALGAYYCCPTEG